jgi:hypothetical protein
VGGSGNELLGNALLGNRAGARLAGPDNRLEGGVVAGNGRGVVLGEAGSAVAGNSIVGNVGVGVFVEDLGGGSVTGNTIAGNHAGPDDTLGAGLNCGVALAGAPPALAGNFWGAAGGPGPEPADALCPLVPSLPVVQPVAAAEIRVKVKAAR